MDQINTNTVVAAQVNPIVAAKPNAPYDRWISLPQDYIDKVQQYNQAFKATGVLSNEATLGQYRKPEQSQALFHKMTKQSPLSLYDIQQQNSQALEETAKANRQALLEAQIRAQSEKLKQNDFNQMWADWDNWRNREIRNYSDFYK